jgi:hypothetical protein
MFFEAFHRCLPELPPKDLWWRLEFIWGAFALIMCNPKWTEHRESNACSCSRDPQEILAQMTAFFAAGLRAPSSDNPEISHSEKTHANP